MKALPKDFSLTPGALYEGWVYTGIVTLPGLGGPMTHVLFFRRADDPDDCISITNGQTEAAAQFCERNGKIDICPPEFVPFATGSFV